MKLYNADIKSGSPFYKALLTTLLSTVEERDSALSIMIGAKIAEDAGKVDEFVSEFGVICIRQQAETVREGVEKALEIVGLGPLPEDDSSIVKISLETATANDAVVVAEVFRRLEDHPDAQQSFILALELADSENQLTEFLKELGRVTTEIAFADKEVQVNELMLQSIDRSLKSLAIA